MFLHSTNSGLVRRAATEWTHRNATSELTLFVHEDESALYSQNTLFTHIQIMPRETARSFVSNIQWIRAIRRLRPIGMVVIIRVPGGGLTRRSEIFSFIGGTRHVWAVDEDGQWYTLPKWGIACLGLQRLGRALIHLIDSGAALLLATVWIATELIAAYWQRRPTKKRRLGAHNTLHPGV